MKILLTLCFLAIAFTGCKEKDPCKDNAGSGGNVTISLSLVHHERAIKNKIGYPDSVFVIYNTKELPGLNSNQVPAAYDQLIVGTDTSSNIISVSGLKCGDYYFYGAAMDSAGPYRVLGGIPYSIKEDDNGEYSLTLPVTEGD